MHTRIHAYSLLNTDTQRHTHTHSAVCVLHGMTLLNRGPVPDSTSAPQYLKAAEREGRMGRGGRGKMEREEKLEEGLRDRKEEVWREEGREMR